VNNTAGTIKFRRCTGLSFPEVAASSFLGIMLAIFTADISLIIFGVSVNDKACRDVVRAAAQQATAPQAMLFAQASVRNHKTDGVFVSPIVLTVLNYNDYGGSPPPGTTPFVQATTTVKVTLPAPLYFFGASFTNKLQFSQTYTSPIIKTKYILP
jgi:hypothetical protein